MINRLQYLKYIFRKLPNLRFTPGDPALDEYLPWSEKVQLECKIQNIFIYFFGFVSKKKNPFIKKKFKIPYGYGYIKTQSNCFEGKFDGGSATNVLWRHIMYKTYPDEKNFKKIILTGAGDGGILRCAYGAVFGSVGAEYFLWRLFLWCV